jgi:hypothetical protein
MRVTIVTDDNIVLVDGVAERVDCSALVASGVHAVQWYDTQGEEEFRSEFDDEKKVWNRAPNNHITDFTPYQFFVDQWGAEHTKSVENKRKMTEELQKMGLMVK